MDLVLDNLQRLICHKTQTTNITRALYPPTPNWLKFSTNVPLHKLRKFAKLFCRLYCTNCEGGGYNFPAFASKLRLYDLVESLFLKKKKDEKYFHAFNISEIWYVEQIRNAESK